MSSTMLENSPPDIDTLSFAEQTLLDENLLLSPERVPITREMACLLAENGFLPEQYILLNGSLYSDNSANAFIPITWQMYSALFNAELITEKTELLDGVILAKMPQNRPHINSLILLMEWLVSLFGFRQVPNQSPIDFNIDSKPINTPEPDIIVLDRSSIDFEQGNPTPDDILLCVEIVNTTLRRDKKTKAKLYAHAGIVEYWVVDTNARTIIVHREPNDGKYESVVTYSSEQEISCLAKPDALKKVDELIAPNITEIPQNTEQ